MSTFCPSGDHDGTKVPVERQITRRGEYGILLHSQWCAYCAEGQVAQALRRGETVTIRPIAPTEEVI